MSTSMGVAMGGRAAALFVGLVMLVTGCAGTAPAADEPVNPRRANGPPDVHLAWQSCADAGADDGDAAGSQDALALPMFGADFVPVAAVICRAATQERPTGGSDLVALEERADEVTALVAALQLPDEKQTGDRCTLELPFVPWLALIDTQGRWVRPGVPADGCDKPRQEFRTAYDQLTTERVSTRVLRELESDAAVASGCAQNWSDMVWATGQDGGGQNNMPRALPAADAEMRVCVYQVPVDQRGGVNPAGEFESGGPLTDRQWVAIRRQLTTAGQAAACRTPASRFAVLHPPNGQIYVEADGCRRLLIDGGTGPAVLRQGTAELITLFFDR